MADLFAGTNPVQLALLVLAVLVGVTFIGFLIIELLDRRALRAERRAAILANLHRGH